MAVLTFDSEMTMRYSDSGGKVTMACFGKPEVIGNPDMREVFRLLDQFSGYSPDLSLLNAKNMSPKADSMTVQIDSSTLSDM